MAVGSSQRNVGDGIDLDERARVPAGRRLRPSFAPGDARRRRGRRPRSSSGIPSCRRGTPRSGGRAAGSSRPPRGSSRCSSAPARSARSTSGPSVPVAGSRPAWPETNTRLPKIMPGEYGPTGVGRLVTGYGLHLVGHPVILVEYGSAAHAHRRSPGPRCRHVRCGGVCRCSPASDPLKDAAALGRTQDDALFESFNKGYSLTLSGDDRARRDHHRVPARGPHRAGAARSRGTTSSAGTRWRRRSCRSGLVTFIVQVRLHPQHAFNREPAYDLYVSTGPRSAPIASTGVKRQPVYPPGGGQGSPMVGVRLEASFPRAEFTRSAAPMLIVTDDKGGDPLAGSSRSLPLQMSRLNSGLHYGRAEGIFFPAPRLRLGAWKDRTSRRTPRDSNRPAGPIRGTAPYRHPSRRRAAPSAA